MSAHGIGGAAFPVPQEWVDAGMSLRDYFAAKVMPQIYMDEVTMDEWSDERAEFPEFDNYVASRAYEVADAMLKARAQ